MKLGWGQLSHSLRGQLAASHFRIQTDVSHGKGQLASGGDAGLGMQKCKKFPAVLLASVSLGNKVGLIITLSQSSRSGILNAT